jgi:hypothetical protein
MEKILDKEAINLLLAKLSIFLNKLFPGVFIMEIFFQRGYLSTPPISFIDLILYIIWCVVLSVPFNFLQPPCVEFWFNDVRETIEKKENTKHLKYECDKEKLGDMHERIILGFILLKLSLTYFILNLISFCCVVDNYIEIPGIIWKYALSMVIITFLSWPFGFFYTLVIKWLMLKYYYPRIK